MADFSTGAELELSVSDSSLRDAKSTIENELGNLEVDVNAIVSGGGGGRQPRDPSSGRFMAMEGVEQRLVDMTRILDDTRSAIIDGNTGGGGESGGTFSSGVQIELMRRQLEEQKRSADLDEETGEHLEDILTVLLDMDDKIGGGGGGGSTNILAGGAGAAGAAAGIGTALGGLLLSGAISTGARNFLGGGGMGRTGQRVVSDRKITLEAWTQNPGQAMANGFKNALDPTGVGETIARSTAQGIMDSTSLDEEVAAGFETGVQQWQTLEFMKFPEPPGWVSSLQSIFGGGGASGMQANSSFNMGGAQPFTPGSGGRARMDPRVGGTGGGGPQLDIDLGGITVDITTTIDSAVDDAVQDIEKTIDREVGDLERRVSDALGGFF